MDLGLRGRVAVVGGSTRGLGRAIARRLALEGCRVVINGRGERPTADAAAALSAETGVEVVGMAADLSDGTGATGLIARARERCGSVDIVICNAGGPPATSFADAAPDYWRAALDLNLLSTIHLCRAAVPPMRARGWGRIVCLTSIAAKQVVGDLILSTTARAGVLGFAKALANEVAADGVTVNVICPGYFRTERTEELATARTSRSGKSRDEVDYDVVRNIPAGRFGDPDELAAAFAFLASEPARYITGAVLQVDGGFIRSIV
jgi:3-oxoacyl-[acyl-carrier protein] reductase